MTDAAGRIMTREHPEDVLLTKLEQQENLHDVLNFCIWILDELGYKRLAKACRKRLEEALEEAAEIEEKAVQKQEDEAKAEIERAADGEPS